MKKLNFATKLMIAALLLMGVVMTSCKKNNQKSDEVSNLAPVGTLAPPTWLIGEWQSSDTSYFDNYIVMLDDIRIKSSEFLTGISFEAMINLVDTLNPTTISYEVKEIEKTETSYKVGAAFGLITTPYYHFKKNDDTHIEVATYNLTALSWREFKPYTKKQD